MKKRDLPRQNSSKVAESGIPSVLSLKVEPLNSPYTLKLWPSVHHYIDEHGGPEFVRKAIVEKLQRIRDGPRRAVCADCVNLDTDQNPPFCVALCAYLDDKKRLLSQVWDCDCFQPKEAK